MGITTSSVADAISFDPSIPSTYQPDEGFMFRFDPTDNLWKQTDSLVHHTYAPIPDAIVTSLNGTIQLDSNSHFLNFITGSASGFSIKLPDATTLKTGWRFELFNTTSQTIQVKDFGGNNLFTLSQTSVGVITLQTNVTSNGTWLFWQVLISSIASGIISYNVISSTPFSTTSRFPTYTPITSYSVTPQAGTYGVWYNASSYYTTTPKGHWWAIAINGTNIADSVRRQDTAHSNQTMIDSTQTIVSVNGTDVITVRVACDNTGTLTVNERSLILIRLGS